MSSQLRTPNEAEPRRRGRSRRQRWQREPALFAEALLILCVVGSVLGLGGAHRAIFAPVAVTALVAFGVGIRAGIVQSVPAAALTAFVLSLYTLLQALPLPMGLLALIAPANALVWAESLQPLGQAPPSWVSISLDAGASMIEAVKWSVYGLVFTLAAGIGERRGPVWGLIIAFASAVILSFATIAHSLAGATKVFGLYTPVDIAGAVVAPLINPNNLSGYLNFGLLCGVGLFFTRSLFNLRWLIALGIATTLATSVIAASRGGLLGLFLGLVIVAFLLWRGHAGGAMTLRVTAANVVTLVAVVVSGLVLAGLATTAARWLSLYHENLQKIEVAATARFMIADHKFFGVGRGAFESTFPAYRLGVGNSIYSHAENFVIQWMTEWGVVVGLAAIAAFAWALRPRALGAARHPAPAAAFAAFIALIAHNLVDLALELPAFPIVAATALGACCGYARTLRRDISPRTLPLRTNRAWGIVGAELVLMVCAFAVGWKSVGDDRWAIRDKYRETNPREPAQRDTMREHLRAAILRHPAEPYFYRIGAALAWHSADQNPIAWIDSALKRSMSNGRTHYLLARILAARGAAAQALLELRLATGYDASLTAGAANLAVKTTREFDRLIRAVPEGGTGARMLHAIAGQLTKPDEAIPRERCLTEAVARDPEYIEGRVALAQQLLASLHSGTQAVCVGRDRARCERVIEEQAAEIQRRQRESTLPTELRAELRMVLKRPDEAERLLAERCSTAEVAESCLRLRVRAAVLLQDRSRFFEAAAALARAGCSRGQCAESHTYLGDILSGHGDWLAALGHYEQAVREDPITGPWSQLARTASALGHSEKAASASARAQAMPRR